MRQVHWQAKMKKFFEGQKLSAILVQEQLKAANVERQSIIQVIGHANEKSPDDYNEIREREHRELSHIISRTLDSPTSISFLGLF